MDDQMHSADASEDWNHVEAIRVAQSVRKDLSALLAILERQLGQTSERDSEARAHLAEAKAAAERGVALSNQLVEMLRTGR